MLKNHFDFTNIKGDLFGGLTAGVVALPLALAFGEASGAGPIAGLWGAIFTGFFAALFGGTQTQVTGPTGPMVVVFAGLVGEVSRQAGAPFPEIAGIIFSAVVLAGIFQIVLGAMKFGEYIRLVPYPVISGFMTGIGVIIILLQASRLFGSEPDGGGTIAAIEAIPAAIADPNFAALGLGLLTLALVFFWPKAIGKFIPGALAALIIGSLLGLLVNVPTIGDDLVVGFPSLVLPGFERETAFLVVEAAIILALLGSIDSLLTSLVADNATRTRHESNKELFGQGIGNAVAGLFGAIPGAGATMRTMVNIRTGGSTRLSGMIHSLLLLTVVIALAPLARAIPHAVLAGILIKVGWDIIDVVYLKRAHKGPRWDLALMALVLLVTVFVDLITAVGLGVFLAALAYVRSVAKQQLDALHTNADSKLTAEETELLKDYRSRIQLFSFSGPLSFGAAADIAHRVRENVHGREAIILDFTEVPDVDVSAARAVEAIAEDARDEERLIYLCNVNEKVHAQLKGLGTDKYLPEDYQTMVRIDAIRTAISQISVADHLSRSDKPISNKLKPA
ncbi:MAG: sodium-independent anion transporter [Ponticaulis sp.]|nr:sodium-independent anion transporter [Ponticaulis sp.]